MISLAFAILLLGALILWGFLLINGSNEATAQSFKQQQTPEVNIAYFIQISESTLALLPRLLQSVYHPDNTYIIHFDKKIPEFQRTHASVALFRKKSKYATNVHVMESEVVTYRGISMVLNILSAMQAALDHSDDWDYFINISGSDYPLVSADNQRKLLATHDFVERNRSFFSFSEHEWWNESHEYRFERLFTDTSLSFNESVSEVVDSYTDQPLAKIHNFTYAAAETWMILHRSYIHYLLTSPVARRMMLAFASSLEPEEHYFATLAYNVEEFNATSVPHAMRHVVWVHDGEHSGQHPYYLDMQAEDGKTWLFREELEDSGCFFARKFQIQDSGLLKYIDIHLNGIARNANEKDVAKYLKKAEGALECLAGLRSADYGFACFTNEEKEQWE